MYNKQDILKSLNDFNYFIDELTLSSFIKNWKIDAIYEDEDGVEFFDNLALIKLKKGISLKAQGYSNEQINFHIKKILEEKPVSKKEKKEIIKDNAAVSELQNLTIDVTGQTLQMLADAVAEKITSGIKEQIQNSDFVKQLFDNEATNADKKALEKQVEELMEDNKKLAQRVEELEKTKKLSPINFEFFKRYFK